MALGVWQNIIRDTLGRAVTGAQVTVLDSATQAPRSLFGNRDSGDAMTNPFNADSNGFARFYSANGRVDIQIVAGGRTQLLEHVVLIDNFPG